MYHYYVNGAICSQNRCAENRLAIDMQYVRQHLTKWQVVKVKEMVFASADF
jgi:hypothetical protein